MGINAAFRGIETATISEGGVYVKKGTYRVKVIAVKYKRTRKQQDAFIVEMEILESTNAERMPGTQMSWLVTLDKDAALGNIKQFISTAIPCAPEAVTEEAVEMIVSDQNPLGDRYLRLLATDVDTQKGGIFTKVKWMPDTTTAENAVAAG